MYAVNVAGSLYVERKRRQLKLLHNNTKWHSSPNLR